MTYKLNESSSIIRLTDNACIPNDPLNSDYIAYLEWLEDGNKPQPMDAPTADQIRQAWKAERAAAVKAITVTTKSGKIFDGDEQSQGRMARAILGLQASGITTVTWVLHDNSVTNASIEDLSEALALAGAEQARLWVMDEQT